MRNFDPTRPPTRRKPPIGRGRLIADILATLFVFGVLFGTVALYLVSWYNPDGVTSLITWLAG